jgi:hypothetical protein
MGLLSRILMIQVMMSVLFFSQTAFAEDRKPASPSNAGAPSGVGAPASQPAGPAVSTVTQQAVNLGVLSSAGRINQVINFLAGNNQSGAFLFPVYQEPDRHIFSTSLEVSRPDNTTCYASASFFPNQDAVYDSVEYVNKSCLEMEKVAFKGLKRIGVLKKNIIVLDGGTLKIFLMPAGSGCVVIKKEVIQ